MSDLLSKIDDELIQLDSVAEKFFNVTPKIARRKAAMATLPVPAFRINGSRKGPFYIRKADLEALLERRYALAKTNMKVMEAAGAT